MTTPQIDLSGIIPSKAKAWVGLIGSLLTLFGPAILEATDALPAPWPLVIGGVFAVLTWLGIYRAPYAPPNTVLVDKTELDAAVPAATPSAPQPQGRWVNPFTQG